VERRQLVFLFCFCFSTLIDLNGVGIGIRQADDLAPLCKVLVGNVDRNDGAESMGQALRGRGHIEMWNAENVQGESEWYM